MLKNKGKSPGKEKKREMIQTEIRDVKRVVSLQKDVEKCCDEAEAKHDISLFLKSNALRKTIKEKEQDVKDLYSAIMIQFFYYQQK